jgi:hypothetical protein
MSFYGMTLELNAIYEEGRPFSYTTFSLPKEPKHGWPTALECELYGLVKSPEIKKAFRRASQSERDKRRNKPIRIKNIKS